MEDPRKVMAIGSKNWVVSLCCGQVQSANDVIQKSKQILNNIHKRKKQQSCQVSCHLENSSRLCDLCGTKNTYFWPSWMFLLKTPFSSSPSKGSRWRRLINFPVNSALTGCDACKIVVRFDCIKHLFSYLSWGEFFEKQVWSSMPGSVVNASPLRFFTFLWFSFLCAIVDLPQCEMEPSFQVY